MVARGAVAFTDDGRGIQGAGMMRRVMDYGKMFGKRGHEPLPGREAWSVLARSTKASSPRALVMLGWPAQGEELQIARDIAMCAPDGMPAAHSAHLPPPQVLIWCAPRRQKGLPVTCEVTPHHLFLSEDDIDSTTTTLRSRSTRRCARRKTRERFD